MDNYLPYEYIAFLQRLIQAHPNNAVIKQKSNVLITELKGPIQNADDLLTLIKSYLDNEEKKAYLPQAFLTRLIEWNNYLQDLKTVHATTRIMLNRLEIPETLAPLKTILTQIMDTPKILLNVYMYPMVQTLNAPDLTELFTYLSELKTIDYQGYVPPGSFAKTEPQNEEHKACISLLNNLSWQTEKDHPQYNKSQSLLQYALRIYSSLYEWGLLKSDHPDCEPPSCCSLQ